MAVRARVRRSAQRVFKPAIVRMLERSERSDETPERVRMLERSERSDETPERVRMLERSERSDAGHPYGAQHTVASLASETPCAVDPDA